VRYPGLPTHEDHAVAARQMRGFGGMLSIELRGGDEAARAFVSRLRVFSMATSLGGIESLVQYPAVLTPVLAGGAAKRAAPVMVRLSVGCEDPGDLRDDLLQALA
jgi:cystathionine gamma-synthase